MENNLIGGIVIGLILGVILTILFIPQQEYDFECKEVIIEDKSDYYINELNECYNSIDERDVYYMAVIEDWEEIVDDWKDMYDYVFEDCYGKNVEGWVDLEELNNYPICFSNTYDCKDFDTQEEAQFVWEYCYDIVNHDIHWLDGDMDGIACEDNSKSNLNFGLI